MDTNFETELEKLAVPMHLRIRHSFKYFAAIMRGRFISPFEKRKRVFTLVYAATVLSCLGFAVLVGWASGWQVAVSFLTTVIALGIPFCFVAWTVAWSLQRGHVVYDNEYSVAVRFHRITKGALSGQWMVDDFHKDPFKMPTTDVVAAHVYPLGILANAHGVNLFATAASTTLDKHYRQFGFVSISTWTDRGTLPLTYKRRPLLVRVAATSHGPSDVLRSQE